MLSVSELQVPSETISYSFLLNHFIATFQRLGDSTKEIGADVQNVGEEMKHDVMKAVEEMVSYRLCFDESSCFCSCSHFSFKQ
jgi:hypothetical protein